MHTELEYKKSESRSVVCERRMDTENWTLDIVWSIIVLETCFTQTARWDEFVWVFYVLLWVVVYVQTTPNSGKGFCRDAFLFVLSYSVLNLVECMAYFLILINWVRISSSVVGGVVGGAISHGPHFSKLKGQTSKPPNDNHHAWCVYCISKGRLSLLSSIMLLLSNESFVCHISEFPLFLSRFFCSLRNVTLFKLHAEAFMLR